MRIFLQCLFKYIVISSAFWSLALLPWQWPLRKLFHYSCWLLTQHQTGAFLSLAIPCCLLCCKLSLSPATFCMIFLPLFENCHRRNGHRFGGRSWVLDPSGCDAEKNCLHFSWDAGERHNSMIKISQPTFQVTIIWVEKLTITYIYMVKIILWKEHH